MGEPRLVRDKENDRYLVYVDDVQIGEVFRARVSSNDARGTRAYRDTSRRGFGCWRWVGSPAAEAHYPTRREAVQDMVNAYLRRQGVSA